MKAYYTIEVRDREGKVLRRFKRKSRSYVRQWNELHSILADQVDTAMVDIGNTSRTIDASGSHFRMNGAAADDDRGVVIGIGSVAVTINDYALGTIIVEGTGSERMSYLANTIGAATVAGSTCSFTVTRIINNSSGATITVTEIGLYMAAQDTGLATRFFLAVRDVLASSQAVPDGGSITVVYTIKVSV